MTSKYLQETTRGERLTLTLLGLGSAAAVATGVVYAGTRDAVPQQPAVHFEHNVNHDNMIEQQEGELPQGAAAGVPERQSPTAIDISTSNERSVTL